MVNRDDIVLKLSYQWLLLLVLILGELVILVCMGITNNNGFEAFRAAPGAAGMPFVVTLFGIYSLMPVAIHLVDRYGHRYFRNLILAITFLILFAFFLHHLDHYFNRSATRPNWWSTALEDIHHIIALWTIITTFKWSRMSK